MVWEGTLHYQKRKVNTSLVTHLSVYNGDLPAIYTGAIMAQKL